MYFALCQQTEGFWKIKLQVDTTVAHFKLKKRFNKSCEYAVCNFMEIDVHSKLQV